MNYPIIRFVLAPLIIFIYYDLTVKYLHVVAVKESASAKKTSASLILI